ncbi:hypothetical protein D3C87_2042680 [compost metagenome]
MVLHGPDDHLVLHFFQCYAAYFRDLLLRRGGITCVEVALEIVDVEYAVSGQQYRAFHQVFELTDITL